MKEMTKILLVGVNAKYIHSNLAIRSLQAYVRQQEGIEIPLMEFSINQPLDLILSEIVAKQPALLGISCYIWNEELVQKLVVAIKKILPRTLIVLGGPEVSYTSCETLNRYPADIVVIGEGETTFLELVRAYQGAPATPDFGGIGGIAVRTPAGICQTPSAPPLPLAKLPFVYGEGETLADLTHRIIYFEASRGCPFSCSYCLSGQAGLVRSLPLPQVYEALDFFLTHRVRQVKFVDRTFNAKPAEALAIWEYLAEHDNGYSNFHFEISASRLDLASIAFLQTVRVGLFQFEMGVQSTHADTLRAIRRSDDLKPLKQIMPVLRQNQNIHLHLDLIVGLPLEGYEQFATSFEDVFALGPHQLQIGFLKLLKGSSIREEADRYGIVAHHHAPYEVLYTEELSYEQVVLLKIVAQMVDIFHNSGRFQYTMAYLQGLFQTVFACYEALALFYQKREDHLRPHTKLSHYDLLHDFFCSLEAKKGDHQTFCYLVKLDLCRHEKVKTLPTWLSEYTLFADYRSQIYAFYEQEENRARYLSSYGDCNVKQLYRQAHIEVFPFDPMKSLDLSAQTPNERASDPHTAILFDYHSRDLIGNATTHRITLPTTNKESRWISNNNQTTEKK